MHRYVIERDLPGAGSLSAKHLNKVRQTSNAAMRDTGPGSQNSLAISGPRPQSKRGSGQSLANAKRRL